MDTWTTPYNLVRSVRLQLVDGTSRKEYRLFELNQAVLAPDAAGNWRAATRRSVHCEYGRIGKATRLHDWTGAAKSLVSHKYDELLDEKRGKGYVRMESDLPPTAIPSLASFGVRPGVTSSGRTADDYATLVDAYLATLDEPTRNALVDANAALYRALLGSVDRPSKTPAQSLCLLMLAERAINAQFYVDYVVSELADELGALKLLVEASPAFGKMLEEPGCDKDLEQSMARLSAAAAKVVPA